MGQERLCLCQKKTQRLILSWLLPEPELLHTVVSSVVFLLKTPQLLRHTREKLGCSLELLTPMLSFMMTSSKRQRKSSQKTSVSTTPSPVNKRTRREERCTSKIRLRNTLMRFSPSLTTVPTSTSVVL